MKAGYIVRLAGFLAWTGRMAGIVLMFVALIDLFAVDGVMYWLTRPKYANGTEY